MRTFDNGAVNIGDKTFTPIDVKSKSRTLVLQVENRHGIYYTDIKTTTIKRKVTKKGTFQLEGQTFDAYSISGVKFHLEGEE